MNDLWKGNIFEIIYNRRMRHNGVSEKCMAVCCCCFVSVLLISEVVKTLHLVIKKLRQKS